MESPTIGFKEEEELDAGGRQIGSVEGPVQSGPPYIHNPVQIQTHW